MRQLYIYRIKWKVIEKFRFGIKIHQGMRNLRCYFEDKSSKIKAKKPDKTHT